MSEEKKVLLKVEHLEQYFKLGKRTLKAVDDVNFEIYKGEIFGLVGESGCGKTTTGRSIIRLYDITGGSVYFDGKRICAGIRYFKDQIKLAKKNYKEALDTYEKEMQEAIESGKNPTECKAEYDAKVKEAEMKLISIVEEKIFLKKEIKV